LDPKFIDIYDEKKYAESMNYQKEKQKFLYFSSSFYFIFSLLVLIFWWFWELDKIIRLFTDNEILLALYFFWIIFLLYSFTNIFFSYYNTFIIDEKFWFNKMTKKIFFIDFIKNLFLSLFIWAIIISIFSLIYKYFWEYFYIYAFLFMTIFSLFMILFYTSLIVPIFNKQSILEDWELKDKIKDFSNKIWFDLENIYVIDASKRSSKANAYFSWFWSKKRIILYDTLIKDLEVDELVAVLAHEIWHYKKKHIIFMFIFSIIQTWFLLYILWISLKFEEISLSLWVDIASFHIWLIAFLILFTPISMIFWIFWNLISRRNEYEADEFAKKYFSKDKLKSALIKLSRNNLTNLKPHPAYEFFHYTHPSILKRLERLDQ